MRLSEFYRTKQGLELEDGAGGVEAVELRTLGVAAREAALRSALERAEARLEEARDDLALAWRREKKAGYLVAAQMPVIEEEASHRFPTPSKPALGDPAKGFCASEAELEEAEKGYEERLQTVADKRAQYAQAVREALEEELARLEEGELDARLVEARRLELAKLAFVEEWEYEVVLRATFEPGKDARYFTELEEVRGLAPEVFYKLLEAYQEMEPRSEAELGN